MAFKDGTKVTIKKVYESQYPASYTGKIFKTKATQRIGHPEDKLKWCKLIDIKTNREMPHIGLYESLEPTKRK